MKRDETYVRHMLDAIERIETFLAGMTYAQFVQDPKTAFAVIKLIEIRGTSSSTNMPKWTWRQSGKCTKNTSALSKMSFSKA